MVAEGCTSVDPFGGGHVRILHVTDHYPPVMGGIESHVASLADRQAIRGASVTVLTSTPRSAQGRTSADRGPVEVIRARSLIDGHRIRSEDFDVVHAHVSVVAPFTAPLVAVFARRGAPTVVTVHSLWSGMGPVPTLAAALTGMRSAPVTWTAVSRLASSQVRRRLPRAVAVEVIGNAVDVQPRGATPPDDGVVRLVSTMRLAHRKRPLELIRMFARVRESTSRPVTLTIVGDGPLREGCDRLARRLGVSDCVRVTGRLLPGDVLSELARAQVYVAPAMLESFGLAALEARGVGLPVVGRLGTGLADFITDGVNGLLRPYDAGMADAIARLVDDGGLRWRISEHNRSVDHGLTWSRSLDAHERVYALARGERLDVKMST